MSILELPREVLLLILKLYLKTESQLALMESVFKVNKTFGDACLDSSLWETFDGSLKLQHLMILLKQDSLSEVKSFTLCEIDKLSRKNASYIFRKTSNLNAVDLSQLKILEVTPRKDKKSVLDVIAKTCPKLTRIRLSKPKIVFEQHSGPPKHLNYQILSPFLTARGNNLTSLDLAYCQIMNLSLVLRCIADCCPNLEELFLVSIYSTAEFPTKYVQEKCQKLKDLCLDHSLKPSKERHPNGFPDLTEFSYFDPMGTVLNDQEFLNILFNSPKLSILNISECSLSSEAICQLPAVDVECLNLSPRACSGDLEAVLEKWCHSLKVLNLALFSDIHLFNEALNKLVTLPINSLLEVLNLSGTVVKPVVLKNILEKCGKLKTLHLESCMYLDRGMQKVYHGTSEIDMLRKNIDLVNNN